MIKTRENFAVSLVFLESILWGLFPVFVNFGTKSIPPFTFAALTTLIAAIVGFFYAVINKRLGELKNKKGFLNLIFVALFIVIIPYSLLFIGSKHTSGFNTSVLLLSEIIFMLIFTHFFGEKTTILKLAGSLTIFFGAILILFNGNIIINWGDILIILSTFTYPIGNFYSKKALNIYHPSNILFIRFLIGGLFLLLLALIFEPINFNFSTQQWGIILFTGLILLAVTKIIWYQALKVLDISKAISLAMTFPLYSILALVIFFDESISIYQGLGVIIMMIGVYFALKRKSVDPKLTKYGI